MAARERPINMTTLSPFVSALFSVLAMAKLMRLRAISTLRGFMGAGRSQDGTSFPDMVRGGPLEVRFTRDHTDLLHASESSLAQGAMKPHISRAAR